MHRLAGPTDYQRQASHSHNPAGRETTSSVVRALLENHGITTAAAAASLTRETLSKTPNFGPGSLAELECLLADAGLQLGSPSRASRSRVSAQLSVDDAYVDDAFRRVVELLEPKSRDRDILIEYAALDGRAPSTIRTAGTPRADARIFFAPYLEQPKPKQYALRGSRAGS